MKRILRMVLICTVAITLLCGCDGLVRDKKIRELLLRFETGIQNADISEITECIDPRYMNPVNSIMGLFGADVDTLAGIVEFALGADAFFDTDDWYTASRDQLLEQLKSFKIDPIEFQYNENKDRCTVKADFTLVVEGEKQTETANIRCVLKNDIWYITIR